MSLAKCLKKLKIDSSHEDSIISGLASLTEQGNLEGYRKATLALDQAMNDTLDEQEDIHIQLEKQGYSFKEDNSVKDSKLLEEKLNKQGYTFTITPKNVRDFVAKDKTREAQATTATNLASKFGKRITWIDAKGDFGINGVVVPNIKDVIFLDVNTKYPAHAVMGHELSHHLEYDKPDVYKDLVASMEGLLKNHKEYADKYKIEGASHKDIVKEMIGDIMGDNFTKQDFWNKLADQDRSLFTKIADTIKAWLEQFIKSNNLGSDAFVKDVKKAREVIALAVAKYKDVQQPTQSSEAKFHKVWHGSPHDHNKFDSTKIGTGEGAQAYGYGHYFAENKDVAEYYKSNFEKTLYVDGKPLLSTNLSNTAKSLGKFIALGTKSFEDIKSDISRRAETAGVWLVKHKDIPAARVKFDKAKSELDAIHEFDGKLLEIKSPGGKLYEVELAPEQDEYLLWDKPLSEQSDKVKRLLQNELRKHITSRSTQNNFTDVMYDGEELGSFEDHKVPNVVQNVANHIPFSGEDLYKGYTEKQGSDKKASEYLHSLGIRGIKYLDGSSRAKGEGAYNYVIFDDNDVSITAKFSRAPKSLDAVKKSWDSKGIASSMSERNGIITLNKIIVPKDSRNAGMGTAAMRELTNYADTTNQQIALTPSTDFGGNKVKLQAFYKRFGFRKNNEFNVMESMIRDPESAKFSRAIPYTAKEPIASNLLETKYGNEIRELFGIEPSSLTREEAKYLQGFRTSDELRASANKASASRAERIRIKTLSKSEDELKDTSAKFSRAEKDYRMEHQSPGREGNAPLSDLTGDGNIYPEDVYSNKAVQYYGTGDAVMDKQSFLKAKSYRGKPDAIVEVYRAVPKGISDTINPGDWVTINNNYAKDHGEAYFDGNYDILSKKVKAGDIFTNGDSIHEWGYEPDIDIKFSRAPKLFSKLEQVLESASDKIFSTGSQVKLWLQSNAGKLGVKKDEIYWSGIDNWLEAQGKVSKQQVIEFVQNNGVQVEDVTLGVESAKILKRIEEIDDRTREISLYPRDANTAKNESDQPELDEISAEWEMLNDKLYLTKSPKHNNDKLTLQGGTDYKELVVTVPTIEPHNAHDTTHFGDTGQGKQIGWLRMDTRDGGLFIEELQSQRAQQGRSNGFFNKDTKFNLEARREELIEKYGTMNLGGVITAEERAELNNLKEEISLGIIPPAPFVSDANHKATNAYITLLMKKALIEAVSNDHASVSWTTGDQQADRYDLSKQISEVKYSSNYLKAYNLDGDLVLNEKNVPENKLQDYIGKDAAEKLIAQPKEGPGKMQHLSGVDLKVGGEWAQSMYGNEQGLNLQGKPSLISQAANDIFKHVGSGKVESINGQPGFYVTPEMRSKDLPLFSKVAKDIPQTININGRSLSQFADAIARRYKANKIGQSKGSRYYSLPDGRELRVSDHEFPRKHGGGVAQIDIVYNKEDDGVDIFHNEVKTGIVTKELSYRSLNLRGENIGGLEGFNYDIEAWETAVTRAIDDAISYSSDIVKTISINGVDRPTTNSEGKAIHPTQEGISNFWKWFGDSKAYVSPTSSKDNLKMMPPSVFYHGTKGDFNEFKVGSPGINSNVFGNWDTTRAGIFFTEDKKFAESFSVQGDSKQGANVIPVYLKAENPIWLTEGFDDSDIEKLSELGINPRLMRNIKANQIWGMFDKEDDGDFFVSKLKEAGYDSAIIIEPDQNSDENVETWVVFDPNQIKSAIGNNGEYSSANNDIRFSKEAIPEETTYQKSQRTVQDKFNRFSVIRDWLKERGVKLTELSNVYDAEERYHAKVANQLEDFREKVRNPLVEKIAKAGFTLSDVQDFLLAQHASEANKQIQKVRNDSQALAYGITDEEASEYLSKAKPELATLANELRDVTEQAKQLRLDAGILNKDITDNWDNTYKHYIPVKGDESIQGTGKGLNVKHKDKRRLGHEKRNEAVIENILMDYERAVMEVEKNRVGKYLVMFAAEANNPDLITVGQPKKRNILKENNSYAIIDSDGVIYSVYVNKVDAQRNAPPGSSIQKISDPRVIAQASPMLAPNEVNVYMDGHAIRVQLNDDLLARAYANMGVESIGAIVEAGRVLNSYLSKVYTGYNPEFIVTNIIRDFTSGIVNLTGEEGTLMAVKAIGNYPKMFADLFRYAITRKSTELIDSYRANGGNTGAAYLSDIERLGKEISSEYASYQGVIANIKAGDGANAFRAAGRKVFNSTLKWIEHLNQAGENAMRLAAYKAMLDSGKTVEQASKVAKNITVNFNRRGEIGQTANALYLFFNASVQGSAAVLHANLRGNHKYQANALAVGMASLGYMLAAGLGGMDEEEYDKIDDTTKERNLIIGSEGSYVKIPIPYGYGFFFNTGRVIADAQRKGEFGKAPFRMAVNAVEELTPFGNLVNSDEINSEQVVGGVAPTALQIPYQMSTNTSLFTGKEIRPVSPFDSSQPEREQMFRNTKGTVYDDMAGLLSNAGFDVSPENIKFLTRTLTGGAGALVDTAVSSSKLKAQGVELDIKEMPFIRKFVGENTISNDRSAYYKAVEEATKAAEEFSRARNNNDISSMKKIMEDKRELLAMDKYANKLRKVIKLSRDMQDSVRLNEEIPIAEKRLKLKELEAQESKTYERYLDVYKARVK